MSYNVHITRSAALSDPRGPHITAAEWDALIKDDSELTPEPSRGPGFVHWDGPYTVGEPWLDWDEPGTIYSCFPDGWLLGKMIQIARRLDARVVGEDGEVYTDPLDAPDGAYPDRAPLAPFIADLELYRRLTSAERPEPKWWREMFGG